MQHILNVLYPNKWYTEISVWFERHEAGQLTNLLILSEAEHIHCLQHLSIQFHIIFAHHYWHIAVGQIAVAADVILN